MMIRLLMLLAVWGIGSRLFAAPEWDEVKVSGRWYVTAESLAGFYGMGRPVLNGEEILFSGRKSEVRLRKGSREAFLNGRKAWLSFPCVEDGQGRALVAREDVVYLLEPVLRRGAVVPRRRVAGVVIDPGHGGQDRGARTRSGYPEKAATLDTSLRLEKILKARGVPVVMTRRTDVFVPLEARAALATRQENFIFVSIHYNAGPAQTHGVETFSLSPQGTPSTSSEGRLKPVDMESHPGNRWNLHNALLCDLVHREIAKMHTAAGDRGSKRARFVVLRELGIPGILVEGGFMTNRVDGALIQSAEYRQKVAAAVARGIEAYVREVDPANTWFESHETEDEAVVRPVKPTAPLRKPEDIVGPLPGPAPQSGEKQKGVSTDVTGRPSAPAAPKPEPKEPSVNEKPQRENPAPAEPALPPAEGGKEAAPPAGDSSSEPSQAAPQQTENAPIVPSPSPSSEQRPDEKKASDAHPEAQPVEKDQS